MRCYKKAIILFALVVIFGGLSLLMQTEFKAQEKVKLNVVLDPGHGNGTSTQARPKLTYSYNGVDQVYWETEMTFKISTYIQSYLSGIEGLNVVLTKSTALEDPSYAQRTYLGKSLTDTNGAPSVVISIHTNYAESTAAKGCEAIITNGNYRPELAVQSKLLGEAITEELGKLGITKRHNNGILTKNSSSTKWSNGKIADYYAINRNGTNYNVAAIIVEHVFLSNKVERETFLSTEAGLKKLAKADATGILTYFNTLAGTSVDVPEEPETPDNPEVPDVTEEPTDPDVTGNGWKLIEGQNYYYQDGVAVIGEHTINGTTHFFSETGAALTGFVKINEKYYYLDSYGVPKKGWLQYDEQYYYFGSDGAANTGTVVVNGITHYFDEMGTAIVGWQTIDEQIKYLNEKGTPVTGLHTIEGEQYYFDLEGVIQTGWIQDGGKRYYASTDGTFLKGWNYVDGLKYYFTKGAGKLDENVASRLKAEQKIFEVQVNRQMNCVTVYAQDGENGFTIPVKSMLCSTGKVLSQAYTKTGTFQMSDKYKWRLLGGNRYGRFCTRITGSILFMSCPYTEQNKMKLDASLYNLLGTPSTEGCIYLKVKDAKWLYNNCASGTTVTIYDDPVVGPFSLPTLTQIPDTQTFDPTDTSIK